MKNFKPNDLVWAKMKSFPYWPGLVANTEELSEDLLSKLKVSDNTVIVFFPDSNNHSSIPLDQVVDYESGREEYSRKNKSKTFLKALAEFEDKFKALKGDVYEPLSSNTPTRSRNSTKPPPKTQAKTPTKNATEEATDEPSASAKTDANHSKPQQQAVASPKKSPSPVLPKKVPTPATSPKTTIAETADKSAEKKPETPKASTQWSNTSRAKDYTRTPFGGPRKRLATTPTTSSSSPAIANNDTETSSSSVKKSKLDQSQEQSAAKPESSQPQYGNIGVLGSGPLFDVIVRHLAQSQPVIYQAKSRISNQSWAAHFKPDSKDVISACKFVFVHFDSTSDNHDFFYGPANGGFYKSLCEGKFVINLSPFNAENSKQIDVEVSNTGAKYFECCMFLTKTEDVQSKNFPIIVAGKDFNNVKPSILKLSLNISYVGVTIGKASMILNALTVFNVGTSALLREIFSIIYSNDIDMKTFGDILLGSILSSTAMNSWIGAMKKDERGRSIPALGFYSEEEVKERFLSLLDLSSSPNFLIAAISQMLKK